MTSGNTADGMRLIARDVLAYLNLSSGGADPHFRRNINALWQWSASQRPVFAAPWHLLQRLLLAELSEADRTLAAFAATDQVRLVLPLTFESLLPAYRRHHRDLLGHQTDDDLFQPFFLARACEAVLQQGGPWDDLPRIVAGALRTLNDFIGYRPVAVLHSQQRIEPYGHEWVCPIPLFFRGSGVADGKYHNLIVRTLEVLQTVDPRLLEAAWFDPALLDDLSLDPRAYDFDHPVNKRPNYQFGQWDPHTIDNRGRYRRFVLQGVTLDALLSRVESPGEIPAEETLTEAAIVLAGTILMASGTSGAGPETHDSSVTLATLLPHIARFRDTYYEQRIAAMTGAHGERLRAEAQRLRQPFGGARQHLNHTLARLRATQLQHVCLAQLFARMGYPAASLRQAAVVPVVSARMLCEIDCRLASGRHALDRGELTRTAGLLPEIDDLLKRAIHCGAIVDPWNILGFGGNFSVFPAMENSVHDHRVDVLTALMERIFDLFARVWKEAAADNTTDVEQSVRTTMGELTRWWDQFAAGAVSDVAPLSGGDAWTSASQVAQALSAWRKAGEAAGDVAFWRRHVDEFTPPQAYAQVVEALLEKGDLVASMALLMQWLSQADRILLEEGDHSFHRLALCWMRQVCRPASPTQPFDSPPAPRVSGQTWGRIRRFFDFLEANAEGYWEPPEFGWTTVGRSQPEPPSPADADAEDESDESVGLYQAAYEGVVYRDSTRDGNEGEMLEGGGSPTDFELDLEATRLDRRLLFLSTVAGLWKQAAATLMSPGFAAADAAPDREETLAAWLKQAWHHCDRLRRLLDAVYEYRISEPSSAHDSLVEYDHRLRVKEHVLESVVSSCAEMHEAARCLQAARLQPDEGAAVEDWEPAAVVSLRAVLSGDAALARSAFGSLLAAVKRRPLLYIPLIRHGEPARTLGTKNLLAALRPLLAGFPALGLFHETCQLIDAIQQSEVDHPLGPGAVTEFDRLFDVAARALAESIAAAADPCEGAPESREQRQTAELVECLETLTEGLLKRWLSHSNNLRLSALERVADDARWAEVVHFIERFGQELFTSPFFNPGNLRAILQRGVDAHLRKLEEDSGLDSPERLLAALGEDLPRAQAAAHLRLIIEALLENYGEFRDYNSTTMQSDRGELLHLFLDFLRIKASYERVAWNLQPVLLVHEVLVRRGQLKAAERWRRALAERTSDIADKHVQAVEQLSQRSGIRLATVADRVAERFLRPLVIARLKAQVAPAIEDARSQREPGAFEILEQEVNELTQNPTGAGLEAPDWIRALQVETALAETPGRGGGPCDAPFCPPAVRLTFEEIQRQLQSW